MFRNITKDSAAVQALDLFKNKETPCDASAPAKVAKEATNVGVSSSADPAASANKPSTSSSTVQTSAKSSGSITVSTGEKSYM